MIVLAAVAQNGRALQFRIVREIVLTAVARMIQHSSCQGDGFANVLAGLAAVTTVTKIGTGWFAARRDGIGVPGRLRAGTALVARGEFSIVIAGIAVAAGASARLSAIAAGYVLTTASLGPLAAMAADRWPSRRAAVAA